MVCERLPNAKNCQCSTGIIFNTRRIVCERLPNAKNCQCSTGIIFNTRRIVCEHTPQTNNATRVLKIIPVLRGVFYKWLARENEINTVTLRRGNRDFDGCNLALFPDVRVYRCFRTLWVAVESISKGVEQW